MNVLVTLLAALTLLSPDGKVSIDVKADGRTDLSYSVSVDGQQVLAPSSPRIVLTDGKVFGARTPRLKAIRESVDKTTPAIVYKRSQVRDNYNGLTLKFKGWSVEFRAYNDGVAYRFYSEGADTIFVQNEVAEFNFPTDCDALVPYSKGDNGNFENQFMNSFENVYTSGKISEWQEGQLAFNPVLFSGEKVKLCIGEADLRHYPGMFLYKGDGANSVKGVFAAYPAKLEQCGYNSIQMKPLARENYIAKLAPGQNFPWRVIGIAREDKDLLGSDLTYNLATPADPDTDWSWVKPGLVSWDWWNNFSLRGVPFFPGINTISYKYYIDFAAAYGIPYIILDEGWSVREKCDLMCVIPEIDLPELVAYGREKGVGLILWAGYWPFDRDLEKVCKHYSEMGIKGFKVDFMDRDDQLMVEFIERGAAVAAKYHLVLDYHGVFKPSGVQRTYPNVLNFEGVYGMENLKWAEEWKGQPDYDVQLPFIRQFAGPMDYTSGAMKNAGLWSWHAIYSEPESQGTRVHQLATYVVFDQPLAMLSDSPSNYYAEPECTSLIAGIPTVWDETVALAGEIGNYAVLARRSGDVWYLGGLGGWDDSAVRVSLSFLGEGEYEVKEFYDGPNAVKVAADYLTGTSVVTSADEINVAMGPGGGYVAKFTRK